MDTTQVDFFLLKAGEAFWRLPLANDRAQQIEKHGTPNCQWTKCPILDPVVSTDISKETVRNDN